MYTYKYFVCVCVYVCSYVYLYVYTSIYGAVQLERTSKVGHRLFVRAG